MSANIERHERLYRLLILLYPATFRQEFEAELIQAFRDHLRLPLDDTCLPVVSAWVRVTRDLARTVPRQRMEALVSELSPTARSFVIVTLAIASLAAVVLITLRVPFVLVLVALAVTAAAVVHWRQAVEDGLPWYGVIASGVTVFGLLALGDRLVPDVSGGLADVLWYLALASFLLGWSLVLVGVAMGTARAWRQLHHARP